MAVGAVKRKVKLTGVFWHCKNIPFSSVFILSWQFIDHPKEDANGSNFTTTLTLYLMDYKDVWSLSSFATAMEK